MNNLLVEVTMSLIVKKAKIYEELEYIGKSQNVQLDIGRVALQLANLDLLQNNIHFYIKKLDQINADLEKRSKTTQNLHEKVDAMCDVLFRIHGFSGDTETYDNIENANLMSVIDRKQGLPVSLGIIAIQAARSQNWDVSGVNFPGHFFLKLSDCDNEIWFDPFNEGKVLCENDLKKMLKNMFGINAKLESQFITPICDQDILMRLQNNIKVRALGNGDIARAISVLETMALLAPLNESILKELISCELGDQGPNRALSRLQNFFATYSKSKNFEGLKDLQDKIKLQIN